MGCKVMTAASGGCSHFLTTPTDTGATMTVGFGQGCVSHASLLILHRAAADLDSCMEVKPLFYAPVIVHVKLTGAELGLGENEGKSTTRPIEIEPLRGVDVVE